MAPKLYQIDAGVETKLRRFLEGNGCLVLPRSENKKVYDREESYWSIIESDKELLWFGVSRESNGPYLLMVTNPQRTDDSRRIYNALIGALARLGAIERETLLDS